MEYMLCIAVELYYLIFAILIEFLKADYAVSYLLSLGFIKFIKFALFLFDELLDLFGGQFFFGCG